MNKDIEKAIIAEQEYIQDPDPDHFPLIERVRVFGFDNLEEYFYTKVRYQIHQENLSLMYYPMEFGADTTMQYLIEGKAGAFTTKDNPFNTWIYAGIDNMYLDAEKAKELGYPIRNFSYQGGPIITTNDDFSLTLVLPNYIDLSIETLLKDVVINFLSKKGYRVELDNNDLLIDGKKILGSMSHKGEKATLFAFELSLTPHENLVKELSFKTPLKMPGYLSDVTREEIEEEVNKWLHTI